MLSVVPAPDMDCSNSKNGEFNKQYSDPQANITFVTEDGVRFRVHDYMLKAAS